MAFGDDCTHRAFLRNVGVGVPTLRPFYGGVATAAQGAEGWPGELDSGKFTPVDLSSHFIGSPSDFGARE